MTATDASPLCPACGKPLGHGVPLYRTPNGDIHMRCHHGPRILVIEDEAALRDLITQILERLGYGVDTAADGFAAIPLIGQHDYDVVLSDLRMPQMDGPTFYREIQRIYPEVASRTVFMSAHTNLEEYVPFISEVRAPILGKPFDMKEFRETLARMLGPRSAPPGPGRGVGNGGRGLARHVLLRLGPRRHIRARGGVGRPAARDDGPRRDPARYSRPAPRRSERTHPADPGLRLRRLA